MPSREEIELTRLDRPISTAPIKNKLLMVTASKRDSYGKGLKNLGIEPAGRPGCQSAAPLVVEEDGTL